MTKLGLGLWHLPNSRTTKTNNKMKWELVKFFKLSLYTILPCLDIKHRKKVDLRRAKNPAYGQRLALWYVWFISTDTTPWVCVYTMSLWVYNEFMYIPWVDVYTMSPFIYHESMTIPWVHVYTISPSLYHDSMFIPWVHIYTMSQYI